MIYNGNLFFIAPGHTIDEFLTPPEPEVYIPVFNDSMWEVASLASWDPVGNKWIDDTETPEMMELVPFTGVAWPVGFRPSKIKITGILASIQTVEVRDASDNLIGSAFTGPEIEIDLDFTLTSDIAKLNLHGFVEVLNIEFLGGTLGEQSFDHVLLNTSYWQDNGGTANWDGTSWNRVAASGWWYLEPHSWWYEGFRPTRVRISIEGWESGGEIELRDASNNLICQQNVTSGVIDMACDFSSAGDIALMPIVGPSKITNIEFLGGILGVPS
jgi:hypothetical protein